MKTWADLSEHEKKQAVRRNLKSTVLLLIDGILTLEGKEQVLLDSLIERSKSVEGAVMMIMQSPLGQKLYKGAVVASEEASYNDLGMQVTVNNIEEKFPLFI